MQPNKMQSKSLQLSIQQPTQLIHVGLVCRDIDTAMPKLAALLGVAWVGGAPEPWKLLIDGQPRELDMRIAHAQGNPVNYELIEAVDNTPWQTAADISLHHMCFHSPEPKAVCAQLCAMGYQQVLGGAGESSGYFRDREGPLVEIIDDGLLKYLNRYYEQSAASTSA
jgi:hypothetical protein